MANSSLSCTPQTFGPSASAVKSGLSSSTSTRTGRLRPGRCSSLPNSLSPPRTSSTSTGQGSSWSLSSVMPSSSRGSLTVRPATRRRWHLHSTPRSLPSKSQGLFHGRRGITFRSVQPLLYEPNRYTFAGPMAFTSARLHLLAMPTTVLLSIFAKIWYCLLVPCT